MYLTEKIQLCNANKCTFIFNNTSYFQSLKIFITFSTMRRRPSPMKLRSDPTVLTNGRKGQQTRHFH